MITEPKIEERPEQVYMGTRAEATIPEMGAGLIPQMLIEVFGWLGQRGIAPVGTPILRF